MVYRAPHPATDIVIVVDPTTDLAIVLPSSSYDSHYANFIEVRDKIYTQSQKIERED